MKSLRPFQITIAGSRETGAVISTHVWAVNCEQLFINLKATIMCNRNIEIYDVEKEKCYTKDEFLRYVTKQHLVTSAFFRSELDFIGLDDLNNQPMSNDGFIRAIELTAKFRYN